MLLMWTSTHWRHRKMMLESGNSPLSTTQNVQLHTLQITGIYFNWLLKPKYLCLLLKKHYTFKTINTTLLKFDINYWANNANEKHVFHQRASSHVISLLQHTEHVFIHNKVLLHMNIWTASIKITNGGK